MLLEQAGHGERQPGRHQGRALLSHIPASWITLMVRPHRWTAADPRSSSALARLASVKRGGSTSRARPHFGAQYQRVAGGEFRQPALGMRAKPAVVGSLHPCPPHRRRGKVHGRVRNSPCGRRAPRSRRPRPAPSALRGRERSGRSASVRVSASGWVPLPSRLDDSLNSSPPQLAPRPAPESEDVTGRPGGSASSASWHSSPC